MAKGSIIPKMNKLLIAVTIISFIAMLFTAYLTYLHYVPGAAGFCEIGEGLSCDVVNQSPWSTIDLGFVEIPVSILGFLTYLIFFVMTIGCVRNWKFQKFHKWCRQGNILKLLTWLSVVGFIFSLYLTYIEAFVLKTWCILCVTQQILIFIIMILFFVMRGIVKGQKKEGDMCEFC